MNAETPQQLIVHFVGSKNNLDPLIISPSPLQLDEEATAVFQQGVLTRFRNNPEYFSFHHSSSLEYNEVYNFCRNIFADDFNFTEFSGSIAKHLYEQSTHPKVKGGELYVVLFDALPVEGRNYKALGIFKSENKSFYLNVEQDRNQLQLKVLEGVEIGKLDKGCLVINNKEEQGFDVLIFDNQNRGEEALYWKEKFLGLQPQQNEFHHTAHLLTLAKQFITGPLETEHKIDRTGQAELLHKSLDYFKSNDSFEIGDFQQQVFGNEDMIESFRRFGTQYVENSDYEIAGSFDISPDAVKKQSRIYKSVLKLDKNFHIYIHGRTDLIEKGTDMDGRKYYKIYYQEEA